MNTTLRKNGTMMLTMKIEHHLGVHQFITAVLRDVQYEKDEEVIRICKEETMAQLTARVRSALFDYGIVATEYCDNVFEDTAEQAEAILIERLTAFKLEG